jgi:hypothetical protein
MWKYLEFLLSILVGIARNGTDGACVNSVFEELPDCSTDLFHFLVMGFTVSFLLY